MVISQNGRRMLLPAWKGFTNNLIPKELVLIAFVVAAPLSYFFMQRWLQQNFAYRTELGTGIFILTGALSMLIALVTVSYQAKRVASADPVKSLHNE